MKRIGARLLGATLAVGAMALGAPLAAQGNGEAVTGRLGSDSPRDGRPYATRTITLKAGQRYAITASSDDFDPMIELYTADADMNDSDNAVAQDDDSGDGNSAFIEYTPEIGGQYKVRLKAVNSELGQYSLRVRELAPLPAPTRPTATGSATMSVRNYSGSLMSTDAEVQGKRVDDYLFQFEAGKAVYLMLDREGSGDLDPALAVFEGSKPSGDPKETDDDGGEGVNSMIVFTPSKTGNYVVRATSAGESGTGKYVLRVAQ